MKTLHIAPSDSAGGSLVRAIRDAGRDDEVLRFRDDLSCGPIVSDEPSARAVWWAPFYEAEEVEATLRKFWDRVATTDDRLVVWFSRHSSSELAFFLATTSQRVQWVSIMQSDTLKTLLGKEQPITAQERDKNRRHWRQLNRPGFAGGSNS
jgi:hypothetical protein